MSEQLKPELRSANWRDLLLWGLRQRKRFRVTGTSMLPVLQPDEEVFVDPHAYQTNRPEVGDIIVIEHPQRPGFRLVKRIVVVRETGELLVTGDNLAESTDSRQFGAILLHQVVGKVTSRFA